MLLFFYLFVKKFLIVIVNDLYCGSYYMVMNKKIIIDIFCLIFVNEIIKLKFVDKLLNLNICVYDD